MILDYLFGMLFRIARSDFGIALLILLVVIGGVLSGLREIILDERKRRACRIGYIICGILFMILGVITVFVRFL